MSGNSEMFLEGKRLLVTGGTGSMGKTFVRRVLSGEAGTPRKVIVLSRDEGKQHEMRMSYLNRAAATDEIIYRNFQNVLEFRIGDVRDYSDVLSAVRDADIVVNAAALKQVPACEYFPHQAVLTNCIGAHNIVRAIVENRLPVEAVISVSTDKACKPVNVMGMTKAIQERIIVAANIGSPSTRFVCVRYGNVLASRGSVVPLFHDQIRNGGPVTVTVPEMTRFLLTLDQAVDTTFVALREAKRGEIYVPNAPAATVIDIARALIGDRKIDVRITGVRPGEKMHEIMVSEEEMHHTVRRGDYYAILPMLPELRPDAPFERCFDQEFSSGNSIIGLAETVELLRRHGLLVEQVDGASREELLR